MCKICLVINVLKKLTSLKLIGSKNIILFHVCGYADDDLIGALQLHVLEFQLSSASPEPSCHLLQQNPDWFHILVPAYPGCCEILAVK